MTKRFFVLGSLLIALTGAPSRALTGEVCDKVSFRHVCDRCSETNNNPGILKALAVGTWTGQGVRLDVTATGAAVEFDCAHGSIDVRIKTDKNGRFSARGTYSPETGGPAQISTNEALRPAPGADGKPARYSGRITGKTMTLVVTIEGAQQPLGTFRLTRGVGATARLNKCY